jgi:hypothetical protein
MDRTHLNGSTPTDYLISACKSNDLFKIHYGIATGGDLSLPFLTHVLADMTAFTPKSLIPCELLIQNGVKIEDGLLHYACMWGEDGLVRYLLGKGVGAGVLVWAGV